MPKPKSPRAVGYVRVSTGEQDLGLGDQRERIEAYAKLKGLRLVDTVSDNGVSGGKPLSERRGGRKMLKMLRSQQRIKSVIILKLDRGFRSASDCLATAEQWERAGVAMHIIDLGGQAIDTTGAAGKFLLTVLAGAAEMERNLIGERTKAALSVKRKRGEKIGSTPPYGYRFVFSHVDESRNKRIYKVVPHKGEQKVIEVVRRLRSTGLPLRAIIAELASRGIYNRSGNAFGIRAVFNMLNRTV